MCGLGLWHKTEQAEVPTVLEREVLIAELMLLAFDLTCIFVPNSLFRSPKPTWLSLIPDPSYFIRLFYFAGPESESREGRC